MKRYKWQLFIICCVFVSTDCITKRALLFPRYSVLQFTYGLTVPAILPSRSINLSMCLQVNYAFPYNVSNFLPTVISARGDDKYFDLNRETFYDYIIEILNGLGLDGEDCLLRAVCETAEVPMYMENKNSLLEIIVHYIMTPSYDTDIESTNFTIEYNKQLPFADRALTAEHLGRIKGNCQKMFSDCGISLVDLFTSKYIFN